MNLTMWFGALGLLAGTTLCGMAQADELPHRKPGLWQVDMTALNSPMPPQQMKMCIDASTDAAMYKLSADAAQGRCSKNETHRSGETVTIDAICKIGDSQTTTRSVTVFKGDAAYHTDVKTKFEPPMMGTAESTMTQDAKWTGPCPTGMQPGDIETANGMKMNIKKMMGG